MYKIYKEYEEQIRNIKQEKELKNIEALKEKVKWAINQPVSDNIYRKFGNRKIPKDIFIVSFDSWINCPCRKDGQCEICKECYGKSPEVMFKKIIKRKYNNEVLFRCMSSDEIGAWIVSEINGKNIRAVRINEVGELRNQEDLEKVVQISDYVYERTGVRCYLYTHNKNLNYNIKRKNLTVNGSGFMIDNEFRSVESMENYRYEIMNRNNMYACICNCEFCELCLHKNKNIIIEEIF